MNKLLRTTCTTITLVVFCMVLMSALSTPVFAEKGWCCKDGYVFESTSDECKEKGGKFFLTEKEAIKYCEDGSRGWCCFDGIVFPATPEECKRKGGMYFTTEAAAKKYCEEGSRGWCCLDGTVFPATPEICKEKGGVYFTTEAAAKKYCETGDESGWCCLDGTVFPATPEVCKKKGGVYFTTEAAAKKYCETGDESGWCCLDGTVFAATPELCKRKGGVYFPNKADAIKFCEEGSSGWCCLDGTVFPATPEVCKKKGGMYFPTKAEAIKYCDRKEKLPDLEVVNIFLTKKCQVVVKVRNNGPGFVPDSVWTVHFPKSSSVYIYIDGKSWGGATIWKFDPGKALKSPGGTAVYTSSLVVKTSAKITATIDHTVQVSESNEMNNKLVKVVRCGLKMLKGRRLK